MKYKKILILLFLLFHFLLIVFFDRNNNYLSSQNRNKVDCPKTNSLFLSDKYKKQIENYFADRIYFNDEFQMMKINIERKAYSFISKNHSSNTYIMAFPTHFFYKNDDYIVSYPQNELTLKYYQKEKDKIISSYNNINCKNKYIYYVNTSDSINFDTNKNILSDDVKKSYNTYSFGEFKIKNYEEYKKYFYKTDYHWNDKASYLGYIDIMNLIKGPGNYNINQPIYRVKLSNNFYGNIARELKYFNIKESFYYNEYNLGDYTKYVNGDLVSDNQIDDDYLFSRVYGHIQKETVFDFSNPSSDNLLIISNSFGLPIFKLIASNYNKTYIIDPRLYKNFEANKYIEDNNIDNLLVITSGIYYLNDDFRLRED